MFWTQNKKKYLGARNATFISEDPFYNPDLLKSWDVVRLR
jgi:hypothetical protein